MAPRKKRQTNFRDETDKELALLLPRESDFLADLEHIRIQEDIPKDLEPSSDTWRHNVMVEDELVEMVDSKWLDSKTEKEKRGRIDRAIEEIVAKYRLPYYFEEWIRYAILYREFPRVRWEMNLISRLAEQPCNQLHFPLTSGEKRFWTLYFRDRLGFPKGRTPDKFREAYRELTTILNAPRNTRRRSRTYRKSLKTEELLSHPFVYFDENHTKILLKKRYTDVAGELNPVKDTENLPTAKEDMRAAATLRQQKSRLSHRLKRLKK